MLSLCGTSTFFLCSLVFLISSCTHVKPELFVCPSCSFFVFTPHSDTRFDLQMSSTGPASFPHDADHGQPGATITVCTPSPGVLGQPSPVDLSTEELTKLEGLRSAKRITEDVLGMMRDRLVTHLSAC
jgi:hypothetical protein